MSGESAARGGRYLMHSIHREKPPSSSSRSRGVADFVLPVKLLHARLSHEVGDVLLQVVDAGAHLVECAD